MAGLAELERLIDTCTELGTTRAMMALGVTSGELTERQARKVYGKWFIQAITKGDIQPTRVGVRNKWYSVEKILKYKAVHEARAVIRNN